MILSQLQLTYLCYLEFSLTVLQNYRTTASVLSGKWSNLGQPKKFQKKIYSKKIFKLLANFRTFVIFQGLIHETKNWIVPGYLKNLQSCPIVIFYVLYSNFFYTQITSFFFPRKILVMLKMILTLLFLPQ